MHTHEAPSTAPKTRPQAGGEVTSSTPEGIQLIEDKRPEAILQRKLIESIKVHTSGGAVTPGGVVQRVPSDQELEDEEQSENNVTLSNAPPGVSTPSFHDNRPEAIAQRKLQDLANNNRLTIQKRSLQEMNHNTKHGQEGNVMARKASLPLGGLRNGKPTVPVPMSVRGGGCTSKDTAESGGRIFAYQADIKSN